MRLAGAEEKEIEQYVADPRWSVMDRTTAKKGLPMVIPHWCVMNSAVY